RVIRPVTENDPPERLIVPAPVPPAVVAWPSVTEAAVTLPAKTFNVPLAVSLAWGFNPSTTLWRVALRLPAVKSATPVNVPAVPVLDLFASVKSVPTALPESVIVTVGFTSPLRNCIDPLDP